MAEQRLAAERLTQERDHYRQGMTSREAEVINAGISAAEAEGTAATFPSTVTVTTVDTRYIVGRYNGVYHKSHEKSIVFVLNIRENIQRNIHAKTVDNRSRVAYITYIER